MHLRVLKGYYGYQVKEDETGGECEVHKKFWSRNLKERNHFEDLDVDGRVI
jgi:hypothetical protein